MLAHSACQQPGSMPQTYEEHIRNVYAHARKNIGVLDGSVLQKATLLAALFHDLGKLDTHNQKVLASNTKEPLVIRHEDAGVAYCLNIYNKTSQEEYIYAAFFISCHHRNMVDKPWKYNTEGLCNSIFGGVKTKQKTKLNANGLRITTFNETLNEYTFRYVDEHLKEYVEAHNSILRDLEQDVQDITNSKRKYGVPTAIDIRMAMSVFIDADHSDAATHAGFKYEKPPELKPKEREKLLDKRVESLSKGKMRYSVIRSRMETYNSCARFKFGNNKFINFFAPTGSGKTYGNMKLALRVAQRNNYKKVFVIVPYTNIINQTVDDYRNNIVEIDELQHTVVNEIHSKVEYQSGLRQYSHQWDAPINVSTSIQFFETMFSNHPSSMRKLHHFVNSVVVLDEYHTAMPHHFWKLTLCGMKQLANKYNITFIFSSGSPIEYWDIFPDMDVQPKNVNAKWLQKDLNAFEERRRTYKEDTCNIGEVQNDQELLQHFEKKAFYNNTLKKHTLVVTNTIANAVLIAHTIKQRHSECDVYHLSTCITPEDRESILREVHARTQTPDNPIILVATSIVECGIDFKNFKIGFREECPMNSLVQFGGRINRNREYRYGNIYTWRFHPDWIAESDYSQNPRLRNEIDISEGITVSPENCTNVTGETIRVTDENIIRRHRRNPPTSNNLVEFEKSLLFNTVDHHYDIIENRQVNVIIDDFIINHMERGRYLPSYIINRHSIPVYRHKIVKENGENGPWRNFIEDRTINGETVYKWIGRYDKNYGVYAEIMDVNIPVEQAPF